MLAHMRFIAGFSRPEVEIVRRELGTTSFRGWAVLLLFRAQGSSVILISYTFGLFLPFIREDLDISPLEDGAIQCKKTSVSAMYDIRMVWTGNSWIPGAMNWKLPLPGMTVPCIQVPFMTQE